MVRREFKYTVQSFAVHMQMPLKLKNKMRRSDELMSYTDQAAHR